MEVIMENQDTPFSTDDFAIMISELIYSALLSKLEQHRSQIPEGVTDREKGWFSTGYLIGVNDTLEAVSIIQQGVKYET
jgi:hypothetical protein